MSNLILDPTLAARWQSLFPISEGNQSQQLPVVPVGAQIVGVVILNPASLIPKTFSQSVVGGAGDKLAYTVPAGYQFVCTGISIFNSAGSATVIKDGSTTVYDMGVINILVYGINARDFVPGGFTFRTSVIVNTGGAVNTTWTFFGYLERISNL